MDTKMDINTFRNIIWAHYFEIENEFYNSISYVSLDEDNFNTFSEKYFALYQMIGSEIDVAAKILCSMISTTPLKKENIHHYCKCITTNLPSLIAEKVWVRILDKTIVPWDGWSYTVNKDKNNVDKISGKTPIWWTLYNKTKHKRTTTLSSYKKPFYKYANLKNILYSMAALFILNMYIFREISKVANSDNSFSTAIKESRLFVLESVCSSHSPQIVNNYNFLGVEILFIV